MAGLIKSSVEARLVGHEDLAANYLKEAFDCLPPVSSPQRQSAVNQLYSETLVLARELRKSGRLSLSDTMYDKAIQIENESTAKPKQSASQLKQETEKVFDIEENILAKATASNNLRESENRLRKVTESLKLLLKQGDFAKVESEGEKHLQVVRNACGTGSPVYEDARKVYLAALLGQGMTNSAIDLMERDARELKTFTDADLKNADADAIQNAYFLSRLLYWFSDLQIKAGDIAGAEKSARQSLQLSGTLGGKLILEKGYASLALACVLKAEGRYREALNMVLNAQALMEQGHAYIEDRIRCLTVTAELEDILGMNKEAQRDFRKMIALVAAAPLTGDSPLSLAIAAVYFRGHGDEKKYLEWKNKSIANAMAQGDRTTTRAVFEKLGDGAVKARLAAEAVSFYEKALKYSSKAQEKEIRDKMDKCK